MVSSRLRRLQCESQTVPQVWNIIYMLSHFRAVFWYVFCIFLPLLYSKTQKGITRGHCWTCVVERTENCDGRNPSPKKCLFCSSFYCNPRKPEFLSYPLLALSLPEPCCSLLPCAVHAPLGSCACPSWQLCLVLPKVLTVYSQRH